MDGRAASTPTPASDPRILRFGMFELDLRTGELRKGGLLVKLQQQPFKVLSLLVAQPGELVSRDDLRREVWGGDTYVDFDQGLNFCIKQIRSALGDQADAPRYVETLPRRGYRFIAPIEHVAAEPEPDTAPLTEAEALAAATAVTRPTPLPFRSPSLLSRGQAAPPLTRFWRWAIAAVLVAAVLATGAFVVGRSSARAAAPVFQRLTFRRGLVESARFAADGEVLYAASWEGEGRSLYATRHGAADTRTVDEKGAHVAGVSATEVATLRKEAEGRPWVLSRQPLSGGPRRDIAEGVMAADWSRDGATFTVVRNAGAGPRLEMPLGHVIEGAVAGRVMALRLSPRGDRVAFLEHPIPGDDRGSVVTVDAGGVRRVLSAGWASLEGLAWSPSGDEVWFTGTRLGADLALTAVTLDGRERVVYRGPGRLVLHDIEPDGRVLLARNALRMEMRTVDGPQPAAKLGTLPARQRDLSWFELPWLSDISADGSAVLFGESGDTGGPSYGVFLRRDGEAPVRIGDGRPLTLSPDGRWASSLPLGSSGEVVLIPTGVGEQTRLVLAGITDVDALGWLPDSSAVVVAGRQGKDYRLFAQPLGGGTAQPVTPAGITAARVVITPDGRWVIAGEYDGPMAFYPLAGGATRPVPGLQTSDRPLQISDDGRFLFVAQGRLPVTVWRIDLTTGERQEWRELAPEDPAGVESMQRVVMARDGQHCAFGYGRGLSELYVVSGLR